MAKIKNGILLLIILVLALCLRIAGINWDQGQFLHPDERFLNMTIQELSLPSSFTEYLDQAQSPLNPRNFARDFFVYGNFPVSLSRVVSTILEKDGLEEITIVGRALSAIADLLIIPLIFLTILLLEKHSRDQQFAIHPHTKFWASLIYALMVLPIQQSHFFTTDTFLNLFIFTSFYFSLRYFFEKKFINVIVAGIAWGLALSSKITAAFILPLNLILISLNYFKHLKTAINLKKIRKSILLIAATAAIFILSAYLSTRLAAPYMFENPSFWKITPSTEFVNDLKELSTYSDSESWFPPGVQWLNRSAFFGIKNLIIFGLGLVITIFAIVGTYFLIKKISSLFKQKKWSKVSVVFALSLLWLGAFLTYYALQVVQTLRYYLIIYPFIAIISGMGLSHFLRKRKKQALWSSLALVALSVWPLMFISIYFKPHSRVQASEWIYQNIPTQSIILFEYWDDPLPRPLAKYPQQYELVQLPVFDHDSEEKWTEINANLAQADYYILSSNRAWGSIIRTPEKYPQMSHFYQELMANQTDYQLVTEFSSYPSLEYLGINITFNDSWAEEAFTVYDHPQVLIFKKR
ncbi:MAG: hypothetical protein GX559_00200 [Candidatus Pacebacteria bacterium]|nr:hypothetical protein [Candidatus Paceibacterota bacterium]